jgi:hypothetical protein
MEEICCECEFDESATPPRQVADALAPLTLMIGEAWHNATTTAAILDVSVTSSRRDVQVLAKENVTVCVIVNWAASCGAGGHATVPCAMTPRMSRYAVKVSATRHADVVRCVAS